ncbi:cobalamin-binding protein [Halanaerobiaceae bacterium Z-7014]|uniref:Cobalamin-binding protein n=1 Tax=Halonatronomonas betaini TaxID=2778430 RepID=A0A931AQW4_9FIRM|nr:cobalamin-binding protein [Halonatronomonas betaini]MBF8436161.1 cobalamin-binding protein [Halonatronomonas betaini]
MKLFNRVILLSCILLFVSILFAPGLEAFPVEVTDDLGNEIEITEEPETIISLSPSTTEMLFAIDLEDRLVGVTTYCDYPEEVSKIDTVGSISEPNIEVIIDKDPDLIVTAGITSVDIINRLQDLGLTVVGFEANDIQEVFSNFENLGLVTGKTDQADQVVNDMETRMDKILELVESQEERPEVFYEIWNEPITTAGGDTFIDNMIELAGGINLGAEIDAGWPQIGMETLIDLDPEVYISTPHSAEHQVTEEKILGRDNFEVLTAVENERVHVIDQDIISRPSPRLIDGLRGLAISIHPELEEELEDI